MIGKIGSAGGAYGFQSVWSSSIFLRAVLICMCFGFSSGAFAFSAACSEDIKKMCASVSPGAYRLTSCLMENQAQLSLGCRSEVFISIERGAEFNKICKQDINALCPKIAVGHGRVYSCLVLQEKQVSPNCRSRLGPMIQPQLDTTQ